MINNYSRILGSALLIAGTSIGAGMLGLPITTGITGYISSMSVFFICGTLMTWSAFLILEVIYIFKKGTNLISMSSYTIGTVGVWIALIVFLGLFYALLSAYISASGEILLKIIKYSENNFISISTPLFIIIICIPFILFGIKYVDNFNKIMIIFLIFSYIILVFLLLKNIDTECLKSYRGGFFTNALSITIVSFAFHPILPTISKYLKYNIHNITCAIILGGFIPIIVYSIWETIFLGVIPITGNISISIAYKEGIAMPSLLLPILNNPCSTIIICIFSLTSILTSFLGVSIASIDFFIDAFSIKKNRKGILKAMIFTYFPPIFFSYKLKKGFIVVLDYAGVFVIILIGILPFLMIYNLKYKKRKTMQFVFISNTYTMFIGILVYLSIILFILAKNIKLIEIIN